MATIKRSSAALGRCAIAYPSIAGHVVAQRFSFAAAAGAVLAANDIIELAPIPPNCRVVDIVLDSDVLGAGVALDVGIMSGQWQDEDPNRTVGSEFFSASDVGVAGGAARPDLASAYKTPASDMARSIGVKVSAAVAAGEIGLTVHYATA